MKENVSSVEYASNWYGSNWRNEIPSDLELLQDSQIFDHNHLFLLKNIEEQLKLTNQSLIKMLVHNGEALTNLIQLEINLLLKKADEQNAALFLRKKFGEPGDPLVSVVFAELAQREVLTKKSSKNSATDIKSLTKNFDELIINRLKILIANQINKIEKEKRKYEQAKTDSEQISNQTPEINEQMLAYRSKFTKKFQDFEKQKELWIGFYKKIDNLLLLKNNKIKNKLIFELATQNTSPTLIYF